MAEKNIIVVVNGYGCHLKDAEGRDTPLKPYLNRVVNFIDNNADLILAIIPCGGYTQQESAPGVSEAALMAHYIRLHWKRAHNVYIEDDSYTGYENSRNTAKKIENILNAESAYGYGRMNIRIVNFCESTRSASVIRLDRHFMSSFVEGIDDITVETSSWERDVNLLKLAWKYVLVELAIKCPWLGIAEYDRFRKMQLSAYR